MKQNILILALFFTGIAASTALQAGSIPVWTSFTKNGVAYERNPATGEVRRAQYASDFD